jgi:hypothetical protein
MILITAAAGQTGTRVSAYLIERKIPVRGLVRNRRSAMKIERLGAESLVGDLRDPASLAAAMKGVSKIYHIAPSLTANEHEMGRLVISAALNAGVQHFVLHGVIAPYLQHINVEELNQVRAMFIDYDLYGMPAGNEKVLSMILGRLAGSYLQFVQKLAKGGGQAGLITDYRSTVR